MPFLDEYHLNSSRCRSVKACRPKTTLRLQGYEYKCKNIDYDDVLTTKNTVNDTVPNSSRLQTRSCNNSPCRQLLPITSSSRAAHRSESKTGSSLDVTISNKLQARKSYDFDKLAYSPSGVLVVRRISAMDGNHQINNEMTKLAVNNKNHSDSVTTDVESLLTRKVDAGDLSTGNRLREAAESQRIYSCMTARSGTNSEESLARSAAFVGSVRHV